MRPIEGVRDLRERRMLSQQELADRAGVSLFTVQRIERGEGSVRPKTGRAIAGALGVGVEDLLGKAQAPLWPERPERREDVYEYTDEQRITQGFLRAHGIKANDSEILVLNQYIQLHERPPAELGIIVHVEKEGEPVDHERVRGILIVLLARDLLGGEEVEAVSRKVYAGLVSTA